MSEPQQPYYIPKQERERAAILRAIAALIAALAEAAPKIDHSCKVVKKQ